MNARTRPATILLCVGEASGDRLACGVLDALSAHREVQVRGLLGPGTRERGTAVAHAERVSAVGVAEAVAVLPRLPGVIRRLVAEMDRWRPDVVLTVDSPGLLLPVARRARRRGIPTIHLVSPQVWAWRPGRVRSVARSVDTLLCLLPFEPLLYAGTGVDARFVGHPAATPRPVAPAPGPPVIGLAPGSRPSEVAALWPTFRRTAAVIRARRPDARFALLAAPTVPVPTGVDATVHRDIADTGAHVFLAASGTVTVELAAHGIPMVVAYAVHPLTWAIGRRLVRGVRHLALPNVLAGRQVVPEHLQRLDPHALATDVLAMLGEAGARQRQDLVPMLASLQGGGANERIALALDRVLPPTAGSRT